jgi:acyl-CoA synthetase (AMP-forming)/AMP-acid ligase II
VTEDPVGRWPAGADNLLFAGDFTGTWRDLEPAAFPPAAAVLVESHLEAAQAACAHATSAQEILVASQARVDTQLAEVLRQAGLELVRRDDHLPPHTVRDPEPGRVWVLTSGSTGRPTMVRHSLRSLTTVVGDQPPRVWLCPYAHGTYAWWQVVTLGLSQPGQDILFVEPTELDSWPARALEVGVTAASGTPTFWRRALYRDAQSLAGLRLEQVTLGGEPVDQAILTRLSEVFPDARVSWIYASSEAGATIAVHDGRAGFPVAWLDRTVAGRPSLGVVDGELLVTSRHRGQDVAEVLRTGDRAEIVGDRVHITGRLDSDEINVGGAKASASKVREVLQSHEAVAWARVRGRKAPIVGTLVTADVVVSAAVDERDLVAWCAARLPEHAVPRRLRFLDAIPMKETLKSDV